MANETERDRAIDRMLRQMPPSVPVSGPCLDADMLAAWSEGALNAHESAALDDHLSTCGRCQTLLATFARTEPPIPAREPWWHRWQIRWLVPLATAATVAGLWVVVPDRETESTRARVAQPPSAIPQRSDPVIRETAPSSPSPTPSVPSSIQAAPPPAEQSARATPRQSRAREERGAATVADSVAANKEAALPAAPSAAAEAVPPPPAAAPAPAPAPPARSAAGAQEAVQLRRGLAFGAAVSEVRSPDDSHRWRIGPQAIEHSTDRGVQWTVIPPPAGAVLSAGHAPSGSIAWFVGRAGAVFVTTDGARLERIPFPQPVDLASVIALNAREATVTTSSGQRYTTTDRGKTWTPR